MKYDKIMAGGNLDNIMHRLDACLSVMIVVHNELSAEGTTDTSDALYGACDLLRAILRDFQADIDAAEDVTDEMARLIKDAARYRETKPGLDF